MQYKVGDKVRIKSREELIRQYGDFYDGKIILEDRHISLFYDSHIFGSVVEIDRLDDDGRRFYVSGDGQYKPIEMVADIVTHSTSPHNTKRRVSLSMEA